MEDLRAIDEKLAALIPESEWEAGVGVGAAPLTLGFRAIGVLFGCFARKIDIIDGPGLPGGLIIYQGHLFPLKGHLCSEHQ